MAKKAHDRLRAEMLMDRLLRAEKLADFFRQNEDDFETETFSARLKRHCLEKNTVAERVIIRAQIDRTYGHQLFNGTRNPSRDKALQLAFGLQLSVEETQSLLCAASKNPLDPRSRRDAVILFALKEHWGMMDVQEALDQYHLPLLGEDGGR